MSIHINATETTRGEQREFAAQLVALLENRSNIFVEPHQIEEALSDAGFLLVEALVS